MKYIAIALALFLAGCQTTDKSVQPSDFVGTWESDWSGQIDTVLTVESVSEGGTAPITYEWSRGSGEEDSQTATATISDGVLKWSGDGGVRFEMRMNEDGTLNAIRRYPGGTNRATFTPA